MPKNRATNAPTDLRPIGIEHVAPTDLMPAPYNPRTMDGESRQRLESSLRTFGLVDPIVARRTDRLVIGGHQRLAAAIAIGLETVPVIFLDDLDDDKAAALNVALNNPNAQGEWDMAKLVEVLSELDAHGFDATMTGFDDKQLEKLLTWSADTDDHAPALGAVEYQVVVTCTDEHAQGTLCAELEAQGFKCRLLTL